MSEDQISLRIFAFCILADDLFEFLRNLKSTFDIFCSDTCFNAVFIPDVFVAEFQDLLKLQTGPHSYLK